MNVRPSRSSSIARLLLRSTVLVLLFVAQYGCQGQPSRRTPIHPNPNMDDQQKFEAQEKNDFFADGAAMRVPPAGTVARGELWENDSLYRGRDARDSLIASNPLEITLPLLKRGQERFNIYCSPCHGRTGDGRGIMVTRGYIPPPSFHEDRLRAFADGHIFDVISNGIRNMPSYRAQIAAEDRWAIVAYVRALQRSRHAKLEDVPVEKRRNLPVATGM